MTTGSISLLRANVALTTNVKLMVDSKYNLYLESYSSNTELSDRKYKKFQIGPDVFISERYAKFYQGLPADLAFAVKNDVKSDSIQSMYGNQFDDIYYSGPRNVEDNRYIEEFQYNTTLRINPTKLPKYFFIFRKDEPGLLDLNRSNASNFLHDLKCVNVVDLTPKTTIGQLWKKNYIDDDVIPASPFELNLNTDEFSQWNGYDYTSGGTVSKSFLLDDFMQNQLSDFEFESYLTDGFRKNGVIASNYANISYLFDDTVSGIFIQSTLGDEHRYYEDEYPFIFQLIRSNKITSNQYTKSIDTSGVVGRIYYTFNIHIPYRKKWTINRYTGYYVDDLKRVAQLSSYMGGVFVDDAAIEIIDNTFMKYDSGLGEYVSVSPLVNAFVDTLPIHFKIGEVFHLVEKDGNNYRLVSENSINGNMLALKSTGTQSIKIDFEDFGSGEFKSVLKNVDNTYYYNKDFTIYRDGICVIKLLDTYYTLHIDYSNQQVYINTDEYITCDSNVLVRQLGEGVKRFDNLQVITKDNAIEYFEVFFLQFTDIADWDFNHTDTDHTKIEYDTDNAINYNRPFVHALDIKDLALPVDLQYEKDYNIVEPGGTPVINSPFIFPVASEYAATGDLYMLDNINKLTRIWNINQSVNKFGLSGSVGPNSVPYKINNNLTVWGQLNLNPNMYSASKSISDSNLDWFYTFGRPIDYIDYDSLEAYDLSYNPHIIQRTLNIDTPRTVNITGASTTVQNNLRFNYRFDLEYYKRQSTTFDYFSYMMDMPVSLDSNGLFEFDKRMTTRAAVLYPNDGVNGPRLYLRGMCAYLEYVTLANPNICSEGVTPRPADDLSGYRFGTVFAPKYTEDVALWGKSGIDIVLNKKFKNILIHIYIYVPINSYTSLDYRRRDVNYNEDHVMYSYFDATINDMVFTASELATADLTLNNFLNILNKCELDSTIFTLGINYQVLDTVQSVGYLIINAYEDPLDTTRLFIEFESEPNLKEHDWMYFELFGINLQIVTKLNNRVYVFNIQDGTAATYAAAIIAALIIDPVYVLNAKSVLPFRFRIIEPNIVRINTNVNIVTGDDSSPIRPINNTYNTVNPTTTPGESVFPNIYRDDMISRRKYVDDTRKTTTLSDIKNLPGIVRFSGGYEPILRMLPIFNSTTLLSMNNASVASPTVFINAAKVQKMSLVAVPVSVGTGFYLEVHLIDVLDQLLNVKVGDVWHMGDANAFPYIAGQTGEIIEATTYVQSLITYYKYTLDIIYDVAPFIGTIIPDNTQPSFLYIMRQIDKNMYFDYQYVDFATVTDLTIAKTYSVVNPLRSSKTVNNTTNRYPLIDEHGSTNIDRMALKSSWDEIFYYMTLSNKYNTL